ncbi:MAG: hypothetical protein GY778_15255 [bacterium]|nr:hypothetical protein [bacterium]
MAVETDTGKARAGGNPGQGTRGRRLLVGTNVLLATVLVIALVVVLQWGAYRIGGKADWTSSSVNSLSEGTQRLLGGLDQRVRITSAYFQNPLEAKDQAKYRQAIQDLIGLCQIENRSRIEVDAFNPLEDHDKREALLLRLKGKPQFTEQSAKHVALLDSFRESLLPAMTALLESELEQIGGLGESLGGPGGPVLGQIERILGNWQRELGMISEEIEAAVSGTLPRYTAAVNAVRSACRDLSKILNDIGGVGGQLAAQGQQVPPAELEYLLGAAGRYREVIASLDETVAQSNDLPNLELDDFARQLGPDANALVVETDQSATVLSFQDVWPAMDPSMPARGMAFKDRAFAGEKKLASAILRLTKEEKTAVVFVRHGGRPLFMGGFAPNMPPAPFAQIKLHLEDLNFSVHEWDLAAQLDSPEIDPAPTKTIYVVFKPVSQQPNPMNPQQQAPFGEPQRKALLDAIGDDGRTLFLAGWNPGQFGMPAPYDFAAHLKDTWGIGVDSGVLLLRAMGVGPGQFRFGRDPITMREHVYGEHPIVERLGVLPAALPMVCPLKLADTPPEGVTVTELVRCDRLEGLWGVKNIQAYQDQIRNEYQVKVEGDLDGPFTVAAAASTDKAKVVVISSQEFFADGRAFARQAAITAQGIVLRSANPGNLTLLVNALHWLNDNTEIMDLGQPSDVPGLSIVEGSSLSFIKVLVQGLWPLLVLIGGGAVWYVRRR